MNFGRYQLLRKLAEGGMAEIFLARQESVEGFRREVVIKRVLPELAAQPGFVSAFLDEARLSAQLSHPHIAQVFDLGRFGQQYFIAMEYVRGVDLSRCLRDQRREGTQMPLGVVLRIASDVCEALAYAHDAKDLEGRALQVVHRDVTPSNVLVGGDGHCKVVDFGIAKAIGLSSEKTRTGAIKGKYTYVAPEQLEGAPPDRRIDLWALGVMIYELLTGENPFRMDTQIATFERIRRFSPPPPSALRPGLSAALDALVLRALQKRPDERFQSAEAMLAALLDAARSEQCVLGHVEVAQYVAQLGARPGFEEPENIARFSGETLADGPPARKRLRGASYASAIVAALVTAWLLRSPAPQPHSEVTQTNALPSSQPVSLPVTVAPPLAPDPPPASQPARVKRLRASAPAASEPLPAGRLRMLVEPWASIRVDGRSVGDTPLAPLSLAPGRHTIAIENRELGVARVREIVIVAGETFDLRENLLR